MSFLFHAHSWFRYLVLLVALAALIALWYGVATGRALRIARHLSTAFVVALDIQILLGVFLMMGGILTDAVTGHLILMVLAAVVMHGSVLIGQQMSDERRELGVRLGGIVVSLVLIVVGIAAVGQSVLGSSTLS